MPTVAHCLRQHGDTFLQQHADKISLQERKVLSAIMRCRTGELGHVIFACSECGRSHWVGRSCGNRHCPSCQHEKTQAWLQEQTDRLLTRSARKPRMSPTLAGCPNLPVNGYCQS